MRENSRSLGKRETKHNVVKLQFTIRPELVMWTGHFGQKQSICYDKGS